MPESKRRKKAAFTPPPSKGERKVARIGSPNWLAPTMVACFLIGLAYLVIFYVTQGQFLWMAGLGGDLTNLVNVGIGFAFIMAGFALATKWK